MFDRRSVVQQPAFSSGFAQDRTTTGNSLVFWWERRVGCGFRKRLSGRLGSSSDVCLGGDEKASVVHFELPHLHRQRLSVTSLMVRHTFFPTTNISPSTVIYVVSWLFSHIERKGDNCFQNSFRSIYSCFEANCRFCKLS